VTSAYGPKYSAGHQWANYTHCLSQKAGTVSVNLIVELPKAHGSDTVMVVVDSVGKHAHFIPTHTTITALGTAQNFLNNVWKLHRLPLNVLSDRGPQFVAEFMKELYKLLGIKMSASTAYHLQSDGQTEHVNQELEQYIWLFVGERQDDWNCKGC
jgi:hypothetical protein